MKRKIFCYQAVVSLLLILILGSLRAAVKSGFEAAAQRTDAQKFLSAVLQTADFKTNPQRLAENFSKLSLGGHVLIIENDGTILGNSHPDININYPKSALDECNEFGKSVKTENGILYVSVMTDLSDFLDDNNVIICRAICLPSYWEILLFELPGMGALFLLALIISLMVSRYAERRLLSSASEIASSLEQASSDPEHPLSLPGGDEAFAPLVRSVEQLIKKTALERSKSIAERQRLEFFINSMSQGLIVIDSELKILLANKAAHLMFGASENAQYPTLVHLVRSQKIIVGAESSIKSNSSAFFDYEDEKTGRIYSVSINPVNGAHQSAAYSILITDTTASAKAEQMRREFFTNASHELKTPITSIRGFAELLTSGMVNDERKRNEYIERIKSESDRISLLLEDILTLSRLEENKSPKNITKVNLLQAARQAAASLTLEAERKNVKVSISGDEAFILADMTDILRMIKNLCENAIKYNKNGGAVDIKTVHDGGKSIIKISDTGIGIAQKDIPRIFERFYRADTGRLDAVPGTGLGLSIVKHTVLRYGGEISVKSALGEGTEFTITFRSA